MKEEIRHRARELGFDDCRFTTAAPPQSIAAFRQWLAEFRHGTMSYLERTTSKRADPQHVLLEAKTIICLATSYFAPGVPPTASGVVSEAGLVARYARYTDYHSVMSERLADLVAFLSSLTRGTTRSLWYVDTGPVLERDFAQRAGVGFTGKHTNLISRRLGNWFFLAEILTTLELPPDSPQSNHCGSCTRCLAACPTGAIVAPFRLDARRCISYLTIELKESIPTELRSAIGSRIFGCDDCLVACPWNRFAREGQLMKGHARPALAAPNLLELLSIDEVEFKRRFADTPILRAKRRGLLRNVCVALGNVGTPATLPALERATQDEEPLVAEHALWAVEQIKARCAAPSLT